MKTALIAGKTEEAQQLAGLVLDGRFESLLEFAGYAAKRMVPNL